MMQIDNDTLSNVIGDIYECALDSTRWVPTLERLAGLFNACNSLVFSHGQQGIQFAYGWGAPDESIKAYAQTYALIDPMRTMDWHFDVDDPITLRRFMDPEEFQRSTFYPHDSPHFRLLHYYAQAGTTLLDTAFCIRLGYVTRGMTRSVGPASRCRWRGDLASKPTALESQEKK